MATRINAVVKLAESGAPEGTPSQRASIDAQLTIARRILDSLAAAINEVVRADPGNFGSQEALRSAYDGVKLSVAESRERLAHPTFRIGTIATTSAGKSTFVNALIGRRLAPLSAEEMSAGILKLIHAPEGTKVTIEATEGSAWPTGAWPTHPSAAVTDEQVYDLIRDDIMKQYNKFRKTQRIGMPFVSVKTALLPGCAPDLLGLPAGVGFEVMDLPGLNSTDGNDANLRLIQEQIAGAFCVMVLDYNQTDIERRRMLLDEMARLVRAMGGRDDTILFVLNKINQRDCADSEDEIAQRIESLRREIKERLGLPELPDIVPMDARTWMHAQCAWGPTPVRDGPSAPVAVRRKRLAEFRHDCAGEIDRLCAKYQHIDDWWDTNRKAIQEIPLDQLRFLLNEIIMPHTGADDFFLRLGERLRERCAPLIIWPAVQDVVNRSEHFVSTVELLARNGQLRTRDAIAEAIKATKNEVAAMRGGLEEQRRSFRKRLQGIRQTAKGQDASDEALIEELSKSYAPFYDALDNFQKDARQDLLSSLVEPLAEAGLSPTSAAALQRRLELTISQHLAADVATAYDAFVKSVKEYNKEGDQLVRRVPKNSVHELDIAEEAVKGVLQELVKAIESRAQFFSQQCAVDIEGILINELENMRRALEEYALARADDVDAVAAVLQTFSKIEIHSKHTIPPNLFHIVPDVEREDAQEAKTTIRNVKKRTWRRLWLWKSDVAEQHVEFVDCLTHRLDGPAGLALRLGEACKEAGDELILALLTWMGRSFEEVANHLDGAIQSLGDVVDGELNRMLALNVEQLKLEVEKWRAIGERAENVGPLIAEMKATTLGAT